MTSVSADRTVIDLRDHEVAPRTRLAARSDAPITWAVPAALAGVIVAATTIASKLYADEFLADHAGASGYEVLLRGIVPRALPFWIIASLLGGAALVRRRRLASNVFAGAALLPLALVAAPEVPLSLVPALLTAFAACTLRAGRPVPPSPIAAVVGLAVWMPLWVAFGAALAA